MELPVEGNYTPNFTESECSINIPGIAWNEVSPRSFRETTRITSPNKDSRDGRVQAFSAQRTSDTPRPTEELPSVESIIERVCSRMCNDLRRSGVLKDEIVDTVAARVYSEFSSRCIRRSTDPDGLVPVSPASGRSGSSVKSESKIGQNNRGKLSNGDRDVRSPTDGDRDSVVSRAATERSVVTPANSLYTRKEESRNSTKRSRVRSSRAGSARSEIASTSRSASLVSGELTRSGTPARGQRGTSANSVGSRGRVLESSVNKDRHTPSPSIRQTSSPSIQSIQSTPRSTEGRSSGNVQDRPKSIQSGSKQDNRTVLLGPSKLPRRIESPTFTGRESESSRSNVTHIPVRSRTLSVKEVAQVTTKEDKSRQASPPTTYNTTNSPSSLESAHFGDKVNRCKSVDTEINRDEREMCYSFQLSSTMSSVGLVAPPSNEDAYKEKRIGETKDKSPRLSSKTSSLSQTPSKIPIRSVTPKVTDPANAKANNNAMRISKENCVDPDNTAKENSKNVSRRENKASKGIIYKTKKKASVPKVEHRKEENNQMNALERRKAYEAQRKLERKGALIAKKTEVATKKQINKSGDTDELKTKARKEPTASPEVPITEKKPCHNEDNFTYEDDFEPMEEEETNEDKSAADNGVVNRDVSHVPVPKIQTESVNHDVKQESSVRYDFTEGKPDNTPLLNLMTDKDIHAWHVDMVHGRVAADSGQVNPSSTRSDVDFGYLGHPNFHVLVQSQSGYDRCYGLTHMHPSVAQVHDNLDQISAFKRMKEKSRRKAGKRSSYADENEHVRRKPSKAKMKTTVGYVPGYEAVRVMKKDTGQTCPEGRKCTFSNTSFPVIDNQPKPGRTQRPVVGYVPGYGPVRGPPLQVTPEVPSERVVLPPLDFGQACRCNGDVKRSKKGRAKKRSEDLLENRARAKPFNTYVDEEASRRFERQYTRHR